VVRFLPGAFVTPVFRSAVDEEPHRSLAGLAAARVWCQISRPPFA